MLLYYFVGYDGESDCSGAVGEVCFYDSCFVVIVVGGVDDDDGGVGYGVCLWVCDGVVCFE